MSDSEKRRKFTNLFLDLVLKRMTCFEQQEIEHYVNEVVPLDSFVCEVIIVLATWGQQFINSLQISPLLQLLC